MWHLFCHLFFIVARIKSFIEGDNKGWGPAITQDFYPEQLIFQHDEVKYFWFVSYFYISFYCSKKHMFHRRWQWQLGPVYHDRYISFCGRPSSGRNTKTKIRTFSIRIRTITPFYLHILAYVSGLLAFLQNFFWGYQTKKSEKAKLVTSWLRLTMDYFPKYKNHNQILKKYRIYFDWPVWPQSDQS